MFADIQTVIDLIPVLVGYGLLIGIVPSFISWAVWLVLKLFKYMTYG